MQRTGTYLRTETLKVTTLEPEQSLSGGDWLHVTDDTALRLTAVRDMLLSQGLIDADGAGCLYWYMPQPESEGSSFFAA